LTVEQLEKVRLVAFALPLENAVVRVIPPSGSCDTEPSTAALSTSTAALSTSTTKSFFVRFVFFVVPPTRAIPPKKTSVSPHLRENPRRAPSPRPHIACIDYDNEHRCAEHEHDPIPFP
jgi:hypothetical protein